MLYYELIIMKVMPSYNVTTVDQEPSMRWGRLVVPTIAERSQIDSHSKLRVALFGSYFRGLFVGLRLKEMQADNSSGIVCVGVATDGANHSGAKISGGRRVWKYIPQLERIVFRTVIEQLALNRLQVPLYTGAVKSDFFREQVLPAWDPDVILMSTFGQLIDEPIFSFPEHGMYNFHPSDLSRGMYPGPNPFNEMLDAGERTTRVTIHHVDGEFDTGEVVGVSPPINTEPVGGSIDRATHIQALHQKTAAVASIMAGVLLRSIRDSRGRVQSIDFESAFSENQKRILMEPLFHIPHPFDLTLPIKLPDQKVAWASK